MSNTLLQLPRVDRTPMGTFGVHHGTALLACQIIAGNAFKTARLALDRAGQKLVNVSLDQILLEEVYYLIVGDSPSMLISIFLL
jgi:hypothetical protein